MTWVGPVTCGRPSASSSASRSTTQVDGDDFLLPTSYFLPPTSYLLPPTSYFLLPTWRPEMRRRLGVLSPGFHGNSMPWSPRLVPGSSPVIVHPRLLSASERGAAATARKGSPPPPGRTRDGDDEFASLMSAKRPHTTESMTGRPPASPSSASLSAHRLPHSQTVPPIDPAIRMRSQSRGATQRMVELDLDRTCRWEVKRAQIEKVRFRVRVGLRVTHHPPPTTDGPSPTVHHLPPITYRPPPTAHRPPLTAGVCLF